MGTSYMLKAGAASTAGGTDPTPGIHADFDSQRIRRPDSRDRQKPIAGEAALGSALPEGPIAWLGPSEQA